MEKCICIGIKSCSDLENEELIFAIGNLEKGQAVEYRTKMTEEEFEVVDRVVRRAIENRILKD